MSAIFLSYRRADAEGHAGRLWDRLKQWFDAEALFYDQGAIESGEVFPEEIKQALDAAKVVLVLIAPGWQRILAERAEKPVIDWVRREVEIALERRLEPGGPRVIPVLLGGAEPPSAETLPEGLRALCDLEAHPFIGKAADWDSQFERLRKLLAALPGIPEPHFRLPSGQAQPFRVIEHHLSPHFQDPQDRLGELRTALEGAGTAAVVARAALYGMGGVGKTQLALKYSHAFRHAYAGVWWFRAEDPASVEIDALACCTECGVTVPEGSKSSAALKRWLAGQPSWLLVYDNAEEVGSVRGFLPDGGRHHVLITSRNPAWGGLARPVSLETWTPEQGADFLAARLPGTERGALPALAATLGGLPLALEQAASFMEETGMTVETYRAEAEHVDTARLILDEGRAATGYERSVLATLSIAFGRLSTEAAQLLRLCAFFSAEPIPERFFLEQSESLIEPLAAAARDTLTWEKTVGQLRRFGLADRIAIPALDRPVDSTDPRTEQALTLHRLTQEVTRHTLCAVPEDCLAVQSVLRRACPGDTELPGHWPRYASLLPHVRHLDRYRSAGWLDNRRQSRLLDRLGSYLTDGPALYTESRRLLDQALELSRSELGAEHPDTLGCMNNLAVTLRAQGDLVGARNLQEQVLDLSRRVLGTEHPDSLLHMGSLAFTLWAQGDLAGARSLQDQALDLSRRVLGAEHPATLGCMNNLAATLRAQGDLAGARGLQEQVLDLSRRVLGAEHPNILASMNNLAETLRVQGDLAGARRLNEQGLDLCRRVLGAEHPNTLTSMHNLALTLRAQGDLAGARGLHEHVLDLHRRVLGAEHPNTLGSMNNLALTLGAQGDLTGARGLQEQALDLRRRILGAEHPNTSVSAFNLLSTLLAVGEPEAARDVFAHHLVWLLKCDPATLGADQRLIRDRLGTLVDPAQTGGTDEHPSDL